MRRINHKGLLKLKEIYENEQMIFIVSELLIGGELFKELKN